MAFHTTYERILDHNINHIYSGLPSEIRLRQAGFRQKLNPASRCVEMQRRPPDRFERRFLVYDETYDICLPRAPALRTVSRAEADEIVARVSRPTSSCNLRRDLCSREEKRQITDSCFLCTYYSMSRPVSRKNANRIVQRLMTPTVSTNVRSKTRPRRKFVITDVTESCERANSTVLDRYRRLTLGSLPDTFSVESEDQ